MENIKEVKSSYDQDRDSLIDELKKTVEELALELISIKRFVGADVVLEWKKHTGGQSD